MIKLKKAAKLKGHFYYNRRRIKKKRLKFTKKKQKAKDQIGKDVNIEGPCFN